MLLMPAPTDTLVWSQDGHGTTVEAVVAAFTRQFWDRPRRARMVDGSRFRLVDGTATYRVEMESGLVSIFRETA